MADFDRPLNRRGTNEAESTAKRLLERKLTPDLLIASAARRAQQTADIIGREHAMSARRVKHDEHLYLASADDILKVIKATGPKVQHLALVGHNPGLSDLARALAPDAVANGLATGAALTMTFNIRTWNGIAPGAAKDVEYEAPSTGLFGLFA